MSIWRKIDVFKGIYSDGLHVYWKNKFGEYIEVQPFDERGLLRLKKCNGVTVNVKPETVLGMYSKCV